MRHHTKVVFVVTLFALLRPSTMLGQWLGCPGREVGEDAVKPSPVPGVSWQTWSFVNPSDTIVEISGNIAKLSFNTGLWPVHDWDLNLHLTPDPGYEHYASNCHNTRNDHGEIEFETQTIHELLGDTPVKNFKDFFNEVFQSGAHVRGRGYFTQDWGHTPIDPKTELHPLLSLRSDDGGVFVAADISHRFWVFNDDLHTFDFRLPEPEDTLTVSQAATSAQSRTVVNVIDEKAMMDISGTGDRSSISRAFVGEPAVRYRMWIQVGRPVSPDLGNRPYIPFLLAKVRTAVQPFYSDTILKSVTTCGALGWPQATCPANQQVFAVSVVGNLSFTPLGSAEWRLTDDRDDGSDRRQFETQTFTGSGGSHTQFTRYYSPAAGRPWHDWTLRLTASTDGSLLAGLPNKAKAGASSVQYVFRERVYSLEPSYLKLTFEKTGQAVPIGSSPWLFETTCSPKEQFVTADSHLLPGVSTVPGSFGWEVAEEPGGDTSATDLAWASVTLNGGPWVGQGFTAEVDHANARRLHLRATALKGTLAIRASERTTLGESTEGLDAYSYGCFTTGGGPQRFMEGIMRGLMAIEELKARGLLPNTIPDHFGLLLPQRKISYRPVPLGDPDRILGGLTGWPRVAMETYYRATANRPVTRRDIEVLRRFAMEGAAIPWAAPPPQAAAEFMKLPAFRPPHP